MAASVLWTFAHKALAPQFHQDPAGFARTLDGDAAPGYLERLWQWSLAQSGASEPAKPPLSYHLDRPRSGLVIVAMTFRDVSVNGEPYLIHFFVRDPDPGGANGYTRMFLLEHSEYATELAHTPTAIICESQRDGSHSNWGATLAPSDEQGFVKFVIDTIRSSQAPAATWRPGSR